MKIKRKVAIVTDSTSYLPQEMVQKHQLTVVPQILNWEEESYLDGLEITNEEFYIRLSQAKALPTSAQPSPGQFLETFRMLEDSVQSIVCIVISDHLSGTLDSARAAAVSMPEIPIEVIDSRSTSMGLGMLVLQAARLAEQGLDHQQIAEAVRSLIPHQRLLFVVDSLEYLHKGGRIGGAQRLLGSVLSIKPILHIDDGRIEPLESVRTKKKALSRLVQLVSEQTEGWTEIHAAVVDANAAETADHICKEISQAIDTVEMIRCGLSPVVGTHAGPGTIGVALLDSGRMHKR